jgi:hypothetical protein
VFESLRPDQSNQRLRPAAQLAFFMAKNIYPYIYPPHKNSSWFQPPGLLPFFTQNSGQVRESFDLFHAVVSMFLPIAFVADLLADESLFKL